MRRQSFFCTLVLCFCLISPALGQTTKPIADVDRIVIISIDGGRPDLVLRANCPSIRALMAVSSYTFWARTTAVAITLPSHVSMLTGVTPQKHGIMWNSEIPLSEPVYPKYPSLFEVAHNAGYTTAMVTGKGKFHALEKPGTLDVSMVNKDVDDDRVAEEACRILREDKARVLFAHFSAVDVQGHGKGWGSDEQIAGLENIDKCIGQMLKTLDDQKMRDHTIVLVTADHGGSGRSHGADDVRSRHIPWIISGPGIRKNYDLTIVSGLEVQTEDTFATACYFLGITPPKPIDGKPVKAILVDRELIGN